MNRLKAFPRVPKMAPLRAVTKVSDVYITTKNNPVLGDSVIELFVKFQLECKHVVFARAEGVGHRASKEPTSLVPCIHCFRDRKP